MRKIIFVLIGVILLAGIASGAVTTTYSANGSYTLVKFNGTGTINWTCPAGVTTLQYLIVAGGGASTGGGTGVNYGAGGAGGTVLANSSYPVTPGTNYTVTVGAGGTQVLSGTPGSGNNSVFGSVTATGGEGPVSTSRTGGNNSVYLGALYNTGYNSGGGAGGGANASGMNGGAGYLSSINGTAAYYAGGGGGGGTGTGGSGGGGAGASTGYGGNAIPETGGGGGGGASNGGGGNGGSGVIKLNFTTPLMTPTFDAVPTSGGPPLTVQFNDTTVLNYTINSWNWTFGDNQQSTSQNITHVYAAAGTYTATLNVSYTTLIGTTAYATNSTTITVSLQPPTANFYAVPTFGSNPLDVSFYDISTGGTPTGWQWDWGDLTANGTTQNPTHQYTSNGNYTVTMTATNGAGSSTKQRTAYVLVGSSGGSLSAIFRSNATTGTYPLCVQFTDLSTGSPTSWLWQFGDSTPNSTDQNPIHTYAAAGSYSVTLTVNNTAATPNTSTETVTNFIVASNPPAPVTPTAQFTGSPTSGSTPMTCTFTDTSTGEARIAWYWDFGDGGTSTLESPVHTYYNVGSYTVKFRATGVDGSSWYNQTAYIVASPPTPSGIPGVNFAANTTYSATSPLVVQFYDQSLGGPTSWLWDFGDGTTSTDQNPVHVYTTGWYDVHLTATNSYGSSTGWQHWFIHVRQDFTRVTSSTTITPVSTHAYNVIINSFGGNRTPANESEARINFTQFLFGTTYTYTDIMGNLALVIIFAIPFILMWLMQSDLTIPGIIGIILGGFLFIFLPAEWHMAPVAFIALSIVAIIYGLYMRRE